MSYIVSQQPAKGLCKKTVKALRWLGFLGLALVSLVMLAQSEQQMKSQSGDYYAGVGVNKSIFLR